MDVSRLYQNCRLCPRCCGADRLANSERLHGAYCGEGSRLRLAFAGLHRGEEPPLSGEAGSGTIFVSGCNLGCPLCQNWQISTGGMGRVVSEGEFTAICLALQGKGAENINIVTGSHAIPAIAQGLNAAKAAGLSIPVLWNSSGYETVEALELLDGLIDTFLPDLKTLDSALAAAFFNAPDYPHVASQAILWMLKNRSGQRPGQVIIRHLILPGHLESTRTVLRWFADNAMGSATGAGGLLSLMTQYTPIARNGGQGQSGPGRFLNEQEYETVMGWLGEFGIEDGFCQELVTGSDWLPDFTRPNPFSSDLSVPVWHWSNLPR